MLIPTRRDFLRSSAAALSACALPSLAFARAAADEFGAFKVGVQSYTFRKFNLEQADKKIADAGLHYDECTRLHVPISSTPELIKAVLSLCKDNAITPVGFGVEPFSKKGRKDGDLLGHFRSGTPAGRGEHLAGHHGAGSHLNTPRLVGHIG